MKTQLLFLVLLAAAAVAVPPAEAVSYLSDWSLEPEVPLGESVGLTFTVRNAADDPVPNHHCTISIYEWRDNVSYPFGYHRLRDSCYNVHTGETSFAFTGETVTATSDIPPECFLTTFPNGEFYFVHEITADQGFHSAPETGAYVGGYGSYLLEAHCGYANNLTYSDNFTVITYGEPTQLMDWVRFPINYPYYTAAAIGLVILLAICFYWVREWMS